MLTWMREQKVGNCFVLLLWLFALGIAEAREASKRESSRSSQRSREAAKSEPRAQKSSSSRASSPKTSSRSSSARQATSQKSTRPQAKPRSAPQQKTTTTRRQTSQPVRRQDSPATSRSSSSRRNSAPKVARRTQRPSIRIRIGSSQDSDSRSSRSTSYTRPSSSFHRRPIVVQEPGTTYSSRPVVTPNSTLDSRVRSRSTGTINRAANDSIRDNTSINRGTSRITSGNRKAVYVYPDGITEYRGNKVVRNTRGQSSAISSSADTPEKETKRVSKTKTRDQVFRNLTTQENGQRQSTVRSAKDTAGKESTRVRKTEVRDQVFRNLVPQQDVAREDAARSKTRLDDLETTGVRSEEGSERPQERANLVRSPADRMKTEDQDGVPGRESAKSLRPELGALEPQSGRSGEVKQPQLDRSLDLTPMPSGNINDDVTSEPQSETASGVTITGNNNIFVNGDLTLQQRYPYVSRRYYSPWLHVSSCWNDYDYGWYRPSWGWSSYSYSSSWGFSICLGDFSFSSCYSRWRPRGRVVYYSYGPHYGVSYVYPRYHRKYVFVSYGGWWPVHYGYKRYYWYGCHPYQWYGTYPDEYTVVEKHITNNYYYGGSSSSSSYVPQPSYSYDEYGNIVPDYDAFDKVREKLKKEKEPASVFDEDIPTPADEYFEEAVQSFGAGDYDEATLKFREAVRLAPEDVVLPFAYCQALFAAGDYAHATGVLRQALMKLPEEGQTVFFPRGLYENAGTLQEQINVLARATETEPFSEDYQLLLGYQLLGIGQLDQAQPVLEVTSQNPANTEAAGKLLAILAQIREDN